MIPCYWCGKPATDGVVMKKGRKSKKAQDFKAKRRIPVCRSHARKLEKESEEVVIDWGQPEDWVSP